MSESRKIFNKHTINIAKFMLRVIMLSPVFKMAKLLICYTCINISKVAKLTCSTLKSRYENYTMISSHNLDQALCIHFSTLTNIHWSETRASIIFIYIEKIFKMYCIKVLFSSDSFVEQQKGFPGAQGGA